MDMQSLRHNNPDVWIVFSGQSDLRWLSWLKPGFRHCYALLHDGQHWVTFDPMSHYTDVSVHRVPPGFDLPRWLQGRGLTLIKAPLSRVRKPAPWMFFTCVEAVKRLIGLHERKIVTPWQLYRHLQKMAHTKMAQVKIPQLQNHLNSHIQKGDYSWEA